VAVRGGGHVIGRVGGDLTINALGLNFKVKETFEYQGEKPTRPMSGEPMFGAY
jgi:hypothetical protein